MFKVITVPVTPFAQNARLLLCPKTLELVVVDPGGDLARLEAEIEKTDGKLTQIWLTHSHLDHCGAVRGLKQKGVKLCGHANEAKLRAAVEDIAAMYGLESGLMENCPEPDQYLVGGDTVSFSSYEFKVLHTPGHSPGHLCFYHKESGTLLGGDTLFQGSIGRTDIPGGDFETLMHSLREVLLKLPDETRVLTGHGPDTTIGAERRSNPFLT